MSSPSPAEPANAQVHQQNEDYTLATYENICVVIWHNHTTVASIRDARQCCEVLSRVYPKGLFYLAIIEERAPAPSNEARVALASLLRDTHWLAGGVILDGKGFRTAFVRSVATGLALLARPQFPFRVCTMDSACSLFSKEASRAGTHVDALRLPSVIADLRRTIAAA